MPENEALPRAREAAERALQLDLSLAEAHVWLGIVHWLYDRDYATARREFQMALTMQPELASAHEYNGWYLVAIGQVDEGLAESRRAVELDPLSSESNTSLGFNLYFAHRYDEAIKQLHTTVAIDPDYWWVHAWLARAYGHVGRFPEAIAEAQKAQQLSRYAEAESVLGRLYADAGNRGEAEKVLTYLRERARDEFVSPAFVANIHVGLGERDQAFAALAQAEMQRSLFVAWWKVDPELDPLRPDPRFVALLKKVGLEP